MGNETLINIRDHGPTEGVESVNFYVQGNLSEIIGWGLNGELVHLLHNGSITASFYTRKMGGVEGSFLFDGISLGTGGHIMTVWFPKDYGHEESKSQDMGLRVLTPEEAEEEPVGEPLLARPWWRRVFGSLKG